ncbi:MAG: GGDEF domain-containing protein [Saccharospirillum sp.]|uniref:diguanylate cyclase domain-containing protein n=1 Tax=Saccharospirillum sp. TaxID=2033801 RepID=UPI0034A07D7A
MPITHVSNKSTHSVVSQRHTGLGNRSRPVPEKYKAIEHPFFKGMDSLKIWIQSQLYTMWHLVEIYQRTRTKPLLNNFLSSPFSTLSFEDIAHITLDAIGDGILVVDLNGTVIYLNKVAENFTGWQSEDALGRKVEEVFYVIDGVTGQRAISPSQRAIDEGKIVELALGSVLVCRNGTDMAIEDSAAPISNHLGKLSGAVIVFHDARQSGEVIRDMDHRAQHDFLTGLPNRLLMAERLTHAIGMAKRHHKQIALLFLDLDNFKQINDTLGHAVGDQLLKELSADIVNCVRFTDTVSRHGGDEFVILLTEIEEKIDAAHIAEKLLARFATAHEIDGHILTVSPSIGISIYPENGVDAETLMHNADAAMYLAKEGGRNNYKFF